MTAFKNITFGPRAEVSEKNEQTDKGDSDACVGGTPSTAVKTSISQQTQTAYKQTPVKKVTKNALQEMARVIGSSWDTSVDSVKPREVQPLAEAFFKRMLDSEPIDEKRITKMAVNNEIRFDDAISSGVKTKRGPRQQAPQKQKVKTRKNNPNNLNEACEASKMEVAPQWMNDFDVPVSDEDNNAITDEENTADDSFAWNLKDLDTSDCAQKIPSPVKVRQEVDLRHEFMEPAKIIGRKTRDSEDDDEFFAPAKKTQTKRRDRRRKNRNIKQC